MPRQVCVSFDHDSCFLAVANGQKIDLRAPVATEKLADELKKEGLAGLKTRGILSSQDYQLLKAKKPSVASSDIKEALMWQEQAHFSMPADQLIIEYIDCRTSFGDQDVYIIAVSKPALQSRYDVLLSAGCDVQNLTIPEFVYADYIQANMTATPLVIWLQMFADKVQALAYLEGSLVATLRLPSMNADSSEQLRALQLFYQDQLKGFNEEPMWLMNSVEPAELLTKELTGRVSHLPLSTDGRQVAMSHAFYGGMTCL